MKSILIILGIIVFGSTSCAAAQEFEEFGVKVETVAENLKVPWAIDFSPDGRIFFTERGGDLRVIQDSSMDCRRPEADLHTRPAR